jgi:intracellular sulfur oxidation DsrE/DsrF family protein
MRRFMRPIIAAAGLLIAFTSHGFAAEPQPQHRLVIQVDQNDRRTMDFALNNATDVIKHYRGLDQTVAVEIMACGPGIHMLRIDSSPVKERIKQIRETASPSKIQFSACNNTKQSMEKKEGHLLEMLPGTTIVPLGVVRLLELQEQGWSYVRP